ncbi:MAG TPA: sigma-70 family RNA polymerase sigma factor [Blastocatellia bacterium]|nr:sigma-70 family RNA polymerase sigma factor [Blastocatellia bacterium]
MRQLATMIEREEQADIIEACKRGDRSAFQLLFEAYKDKVYSIALHYGSDPTMAHDITQQVFLKLFNVIGQFRQDSDFGTWLYRIVANACVDEQRKRKRFVPFSPEVEVKDSAAQSQEQAFHLRQVSESVRGAIAELSPKLRMPILLKYVEGLSYDEIAEALGCSIGTVSSRLNRGHKMLATKLGHLRGEIAAGE